MMAPATGKHKHGNGDAKEGEKVAVNRVRLERATILRAALALADREGLDGLTMRALGAEVGVEAPSLYKHVASKDDILDGIVDALYDEVTAQLDSSSGERWNLRVHAYANSLRRTMLDHPKVAPLLATRTVPGEASLMLVEHALEELGAVFHDPQQQVTVLNIFSAFVMGHVLSQIASQTEEAEELARRRAGLPETSFPRVRATLGAGLVDHDLEFSLGLDVVVTGLEQMILGPGAPEGSSEG